MKQFFFSAALFLIGAGTASADYMLIKIDLNKMNFIPTPAMMGGAAQGGGAGAQGGGAGAGGGAGLPVGMGGGAGFMGGQPFPPKDPKSPGGPPVIVDDPNAKWVSAWVETKNRSKLPAMSPLGSYFTYEHKWSTRPGCVPTSTSLFPWVANYVPAETFAKEFDAKFGKEKRDAAANKDKLDKGRIVENYLHLARWALSRGSVTSFDKVMAEIEAVDPKHAVVKNYYRAQKALKQPLKNEDPAQFDLLQELKQGGYKATTIKTTQKRPQPHFCIHSQSIGTDQAADAVITRRLAMMEDTLEIFYYWFAVQRDGAVQPAFPKYRLNAIMTGSKEEFKTRHLQWGSLPMVADGFTPRRDNVIVMSTKVRLNDPLYNELETLINSKLQAANVQFEQLRINFTRDDLLSGKIYDAKETAKFPPIVIGAAQTAVLLARHLEDEAERHTVTHETVRQLLIASEMFPRNVQIPEWMVEGLAALLETPARAIYPTIGAPSWTHGISFKYLRTKTQKLAVPHDVLNNVLRDTYFQDARQSSKDMQDQPASPELQRAQREAWELARCTAWSFTYYLSQKGKLDYLFNYGKELNRLPRDMDLNEQVLETCFAKAFAMTDAQDAQKLDSTKVQYMAGNWFELMDIVNLEPAAVRDYYENERARLDGPPAGAPPANPNPPAKGDPNPPPNPDPQQPSTNLVGTTWTGTEGFADRPQLKMTLHFTAPNKVSQTTVSVGSIVSQGTWTQTGNSVTMKFANDTNVYTGTINGNQMQGTKTDQLGTKNWTWSATNGGGNPNQANNPNPNRPPAGGVRPPPPPVRPPPPPPRRP